MIKFTNDNESGWKRKAYITGSLIGVSVGLLASYFYVRAAEESDDPRAGEMNSISTGQMLALVLALLGLVRQISELGRPKKK
ncbi:hypothetical protein MASR2M15_20190 [Anaerolineales bacterium]